MRPCEYDQGSREGQLQSLQQNKYTTKDEQDSANDGGVAVINSLQFVLKIIICFCRIFVFKLALLLESRSLSQC